MNEVKVLIAGSGNTTGLNVIKALIPTFQVIGCDYNEINPANAFCENFLVPPCHASTYPTRVLELVDTYHVTHIIATNDHDVRSLSLLYEELKKRNVHFNGYCENVFACLDKERTSKMFAENHILTPTELPKDYRTPPFVLRKREMGNERKFLYIIRSKEDIETVPLQAFEKGILTQYVEGEEYTIDVLCDDKSSLLAAVPRLRIEVNNGMVWHGKIVKDTILIDKVREVVSKIGLRGIACIQCIKQGNRYYFIEINPRPGSGIDLSINGNVNLPQLWIQLTLGGKIEIPSPDWGLQLVRYYTGYYFK